MRIYLAKTLENMKKYGSVYDLSMESVDRVVTMNFSEDANSWMLEHFVSRINAECDTLLDDGDYDYLNISQCKRLINLLQKTDNRTIPDEIKPVFACLEEYAQKAVEQKTGMAIEM